MPPARTFDLQAVHDIANGQGGVVTFRQLTQAGVSQGTISRWTRTGGRWQRPLPAVYVLHRGTLTPDERIWAASAYAGSDGMFTGLLALHLHGLHNVRPPGGDADLHLLIPYAQQTQSAAFVVLERTRRLPEPLIRGGHRVAPVARAIFDAGRRTPNRQMTRAFTLEAIQRKLVTVEQVREEIKHGQRQWTAVLRDVVGEAEDGVLSVPEAELRTLVEGTNLPRPLWNPRLETPSGEFIAEPDGYLEEVGLAMEVDSRKYHFTDSDHYAKTWRRHARYAEHGITVLRIMPADIRKSPTSVLKTIHATVNTLRGRPLPTVVAIPRGSRQKDADG